ncbi:MAG: HD domain-containing protein [Chloroflexaceae bacterium]|nr:HD domain-containing protein [Chloroflexaceae bacterium]
MNVTTLLDQYDVDRAHARHVADLALKLFDESRPLHAMSKRARRLLEVGALLHNVGMHVDEEQHHIAGRDIVLDEPLADLDEDERAVVACLVMFHRKKVRAHLEPAFLRLGRKDRQMVLRLAAILRIADGLDYSETQTSRINALRITDEQTILHLDVPHMADDLKRANRKADLWRKVLNPSLELIADTPTPDAVAAMAFENGTVAFIAPHTIRLDDVEASTDRATLEEVDTPAAPDLAPVEPAGKPAIRPTFTAQDRLADLGRRLLRTYFQQLLIEEKGVQAGDTPEPVHKMRVATVGCGPSCKLSAPLHQSAPCATSAKNCACWRRHWPRCATPMYCWGACSAIRRGNPKMLPST